MDYRPIQTVFNLGVTTMNGNTVDVPLEILSDLAVEGNHSFSVEVVNTELVTPGQSSEIVIIDNDCKKCPVLTSYTLKLR